MYELAQETGNRRDTRRFLGRVAEQVVAARHDPRRLTRTFDGSPIPMVIVDGERRYLEVNVPARLAFRLTLPELRRLRIEDLTPQHLLPTLHEAWSRLMDTGCVTGDYEVAGLDGGTFGIYYWASSGLPDSRHLIAFAPAGWTQDDLADSDAHVSSGGPLTPREVEVLELAATGHSGPAIAEQLVVSPGTVRTHFENIYEKLCVSDRAAAVARAMRLGLIR